MRAIIPIILFWSQAVFATEYAEVISSQPRLVTVNQQQCEQVSVVKQGKQENTAGGVLGAIAGAAIGNQVGGGSGKDIATAAGAVIGYQVGKGTETTNQLEYQTVCKNMPVTTYKGEIVTFKYKGKIFVHTFD